VVDLLEGCYFGDLAAGNEPVSQLVRAVAAGLGADGSFLPERHQIVCCAERAPEDCEDIVQRLVYRADLPTGRCIARSVSNLDDDLITC
jgi:hypothetical protein